MDATLVTALLGGVGLFILGMQMMTDGLKLAAGNALRSVLERWTSSAWRGLLAGFLITALVQSSSAVTVATVGFVNAGLLTLTQAVWVVFGTNVGTTMTGWLVALVGVKVDVAALALPLLGSGMLLRLALRASVRWAALGEAIAGFGAFFLGVAVLQSGFESLAPRLTIQAMENPSIAAYFAFFAAGALLTVLTQSSSAAMAITLTASAGGAVPLELAAAVVVGTNVGTTSTAGLAAIGSTPPAKRVATAHVAFNLLTGAVALALLPLLLGASRMLAGALAIDAESAATLAVFHTLFNCLGVALVWPVAPKLVRWLSLRYATAEEELGTPQHLDATLTAMPSLALRAAVLESARMMDAAFDLARRRLGAATGARTALEQQQAGLLVLGQRIRGFLGELSGGPLPADVVAALPDLVRAIQHLEDLAAVTDSTRELGAPEAALANITGADGTELYAAALAALRRDAGDAERRSSADIEMLAERAEAAYQSSKRKLLDAAAHGKLSVDAMEAGLRRARLLRRCTEVAVKAQRRLLPWLAREVAS